MASEIMLMGLNKKPRRKRKGGKSRRRRHRRAATAFPTRRRRRRGRSFFGRRRRRGGMSLGGGSIVNSLKTAGMVAAGGVLLDVLYSYLPVPANMKVGPVSWLTKGAAAFGLAIVARKVVDKSTADKIALGAMAVVVYGALRSAVNTVAPSLQLGLYDDLGLYSTGAYNAVEGLGYMGAGQGGGGMLTGPESAIPNEANFSW